MAGPWEDYQNIEGPWTEYQKASNEETPKTNQGWRGDVAAAMRGAREQIPFGRDLGALLKSYTNNVPFEEEKRRQEARDAALAKEHPWSYGAGEVAGGIGTVLAPELAGIGMASKALKGEQAVAKALTPYLGTTDAKIATALGSGMASGAAQGAVHGLGTGTSLDERLGHAAEEAAVGAPLGLAGTALGHAASRGLRKAGEIAGRVAPLPKGPTSEEILKRGSAAYDLARAQDLFIGAPHVASMVNNLEGKLAREGYRPKLHPKIGPALDELRSHSGAMTLDDLDQIYRLTRSAAVDWTDRDQQRIAGIFRGHINNFLDTLHPTQTWSRTGSPTAAVSSLKQGRQLWKQGRKMEQIQEMINAAKDRAQTSGTGGNYNNTLRQEARKLHNEAKRHPRMWTTDELQALKELYGGTISQNTARLLGRFSPAHHPLIGTAEVIAGLSNPTAALGMAAAGLGAHMAEDQLTNMAKKNLVNIVAAKGDKSRVPQLNPMESLVGRQAGAIGVPSFMASPEEHEDDIGPYASGGSVKKRDYPAKRLTRMEKAVKRAQDAIALETKPLMNQPDHVIAQALEIAKVK